MHLILQLHVLCALCFPNLPKNYVGSFYRTSTIFVLVLRRAFAVFLSSFWYF